MLDTITAAIRAILHPPGHFPISSLVSSVARCRWFLSMSLCAAISVLYAVSVHAQTNLVVNGSFEEGLPIANQFVTLGAGSTEILGWTVTRGGIDYADSANFTASDGSRSVDLNASPGVGGIRQSVPTVPGRNYVIVFAFAGNPIPLQNVKRMRIQAGNTTSPQFTFDTSGHSAASPGWVMRSWEFIASSTMTNVEFYSETLDGFCTCCSNVNCAGPLLDRVQIFECLALASQPQNTIGCSSAPATFSVTALGSDPFTYQWQIELPGSPGTWATLGNDPMPLPCSGFAYASPLNAATASIGVSPCPGVTQYEIRCIVTNACGSVTSDPVTLTVVGANPGDPNGDGLRDGRDIQAFVDVILAGPTGGPSVARCAADTDGNSVVDFGDLSLFVAQLLIG